MGAAKCFQIASMVFIFAASGVFIGAFSGTGWLSGHQYDYGLWRMCESNSTGTETCRHLSLGSQQGYFEATRALASFALVFCIISTVACFVEENEEDRGLKKTCYRYFFCLSSLITVALLIITLAVMGGRYKEDPQFADKEMQTGWCLALTGLSAALAFISCVCRFKFITSQHDTDYPGPCCFTECQEHKTQPDPTSHPDLDISAVSAAGDAAGDAALYNGRSPVPSLMIRRTSSATSDGLDGRIAHLPPLPQKARGGATLARSSSLRSTDSGLDSKDVSRDSILDETTGPLPLSVEMLKRHDRRLTGVSGRRFDDRRRRPAFSSTTSLSTTDSQSSAELAPRVHTPTNMKRVHYNDVPKEHRQPQEPLSTDGPPPPQSFCQAGHGSQAPPIISFPIKVQGVELSRAKTNANASSTIDNLRAMSSALRKWRGPAAETIVEEEKVGDSGESRASSRQKRTKSKKSKRKKSKETTERE